MKDLLRFAKNSAMHGMSIGEFFNQELELFLLVFLAHDKEQEEKLTNIDEISWW